MKKKSIAARLGVLALALTLATTSLSSGTLAKFVTAETFQTQFTVAKWNAHAQVKLSTGTWNAASSADNVSVYNLVESATGTYTNKAVASGVIAPGMGGQFVLDLKTAWDATKGDNSGDVTQVAGQYLVYVKAKGNVPANFKLFDGNKTTESSPIDWEGEADDSEHGFLLSSGTWEASERKDLQVNLYWKWSYESGANDTAKAAVDKVDTSDGAAPVADQKIEFYVLMKQLNPTEAFPT